MTTDMESNFILQEVKAAMIEYYTLLCSMPHYPPDGLELPPPEGWPNVDVEALRKLGKSDAAIEFMRHLPCLKPCLNCEKAWITPLSPALNFHHGETWQQFFHEYFPTPPHLVYLSMGISGQHGTELLLDTQRGTIVEKSAHGGPVMVSWEEYDALADEEKWTGHRGLSAADFFAKEALSLQRLAYMPVPPVHRKRDEPEFYTRASSEYDFMYLSAFEDEWEADHEVDSDYMDTDEDGGAQDANLEYLRLQSGEEKDEAKETNLEDLRLDSSGEDSDEEMDISEDELQDLATDFEEHKAEIEAKYSDPSFVRLEPRWSISENALLVYDIFKRNGWPYAHFDLERCRAELLEFQARADKKADLKRELSSRPPRSRTEWLEERLELLDKNRTNFTDAKYLETRAEWLEKLRVWTAEAKDKQRERAEEVQRKITVS